MKRIYLVRHGETKYNESNLVQDEFDTLSSVGKIQSELVANRIKQLSFNILYTSDYIRAIETANIITDFCECGYKPSDIFREVRRPSQFVGLSRNNPDYLNFLKEANDHIADPSWHYEDEENFHDVMIRVRSAFSIFDSGEGDMVVVTHGRFLMFLVMYVLSNRELHAGLWKLSAHTMNSSNTGLTIFEYDEDFSHWRLKTYNDIAHFAE